MHKQLLTLIAALLLATGPALAGETVSDATLQAIVDMYKTELGQRTSGVLPVRDPAEIRPGGWTDKWDENAERSVAAHRNLVLNRPAIDTITLLVPVPALPGASVDRETLRTVVDMYKTEFGQSTSGTSTARNPAEIRPGGWTDKWDEKAEESITVHRKQVLGSRGGQM